MVAEFSGAAAATDLHVQMVQEDVSEVNWSIGAGEPVDDIYLAFTLLEDQPITVLNVHLPVSTGGISALSCWLYCQLSNRIHAISLLIAHRYLCSHVLFTNELNAHTYTVHLGTLHHRYYPSPAPQVLILPCTPGTTPPLHPRYYPSPAPQVLPVPCMPGTTLLCTPGTTPPLHPRYYPLPCSPGTTPSLAPQAKVLFKRDFFRHVL